jgi:hypothetical protein
MVTVFVRWGWLRAVLHSGWWLVATVYLVVDAGLREWIRRRLDHRRTRPAGPDHAVLARAARAQLTGAATGLIVLGLLAWATRRNLTIVIAGAAMTSLALYAA